MRCPDCGPTIKVREAIGTIIWQLIKADHARYAVLTIPHFDWTMDQLRREVNEVVRRIRRWGYAIEAAYIIAEFEADTGYHVDFYSYGDYIDQKIWQKANRAEIVNIQEIKANKSRTIGYAFKETLGYAFKATEGGLERHLELNGGKLYRTTRSFYGSLTRREAEVAGRAHKRAEQGESRWEVLYGGSDRKTPPWRGCSSRRHGRSSCGTAAIGVAETSRKRRRSSSHSCGLTET
ncbi:hypothetical protein HQ535_10265 [bacterium]|nr:hypothetical protein [bacterium]